MNDTTTLPELTRFIERDLLDDRSDFRLGDDDDLLTSGLVDSLRVMRLVAFLEKRYGMTIPPVDVTIEHFVSVKAIAAYLQTRGVNDAATSTD